MWCKLCLLYSKVSKVQYLRSIPSFMSCILLSKVWVATNFSRFYHQQRIHKQEMTHWELSTSAEGICALYMFWQLLSNSSIPPYIYISPLPVTFILWLCLWRGLILSIWISDHCRASKLNTNRSSAGVTLQPPCTYKLLPTVQKQLYAIVFEQTHIAIVQ